MPDATIGVYLREPACARRSQRVDGRSRGHDLLNKGDDAEIKSRTCPRAVDRVS
jgi:hypothetical protein